jgi:hypothetical protein
VANDYGIRSGLVNKGYSNDDIGYDQNTGYVTVKGQNFMKPDLNLAGTTYTSQQNFDNAYNQLQKSSQQGPLPTYAMQGTQQQPTSQYKNPYMDQYTQMIGQIQQQLANPTPINPYSTPQYAAAQAQAQKASQQGIRSAQEAFGSSGFGRSTALGNAAQRVQNDADAYLMTQVVPNIVNQLNNERQQQIQNQFSLMNPIMSLLNREDNQAQQARTNARADAALTGQYLPADAQTVINQILGLKQKAESGALDPESARIEADRYRNQLASMGIDPNVVGYDADYNQAQQNVAQGFPTLQARTDQRDFDYKAGRDVIGDERNQRLDNLNEMQVMAQLTGYLPDGTPTNAQQQQMLENLWQVADATGTIPNELAQLYGIPAGTTTLQAKQIAASIANANAASARAGVADQRTADNQRLGALMEVWDRTGKAPAGIPGVQEGTTLAGTKAPKETKIDAKTSADNYDMILEDLNSPNVTKEVARQLVEANKDFLSDADYKKLRDHINDNF